MMTFGEIQIEELSSIETFEREVMFVYREFVLPHFNDTEFNHFPQTLYGYMMNLFARIDYLSACWKGNTSSKAQTIRMIDFMGKYISSDSEANSVAVQMWRHKLMHTSQPRSLIDNKNETSYKWLLHWFEQLSIEQHYTISAVKNLKIINLSLIYLISDVKRGLRKYLEELSCTPELLENYLKAQELYASSEYRTI